MNILILKNVFQNLISSTCGEFQLYFNDNLNKKTLETMINEMFSTNADDNEHIIKNFKKEYDL